MSDYNWNQTPLVTDGNPVVGQTGFGQNTNNSNRMQPDAYYSDMFLERKRFKGEDLVFAHHAETRTIKKGLDTINLRRYQPLKAHIVPLVEGLPPIGDRAHGKAIIAKTRQYGRFMEFTDLFEYKVADPVIEEYTVELADLANETIDMLAQAALLAEAQVFYPLASKATSKALLATAATDTSDAVKDTSRPRFDDLRIMKLTMEVAKVKSIGGTYPVLASPAVFFDLQIDPTVVAFMQYGQTNSPISTDSIPSVYGITIFKAQTAKVESVETAPGSKVSAMVHHSIMLGAKAYSKIEIADGGNVQFFSKELGSAGTLDPLNQRRTMGWKINAIGFKVTDPDAVIDYMSVPSQAEIITDNFDYVSDVVEEIGITEAMLTAKIAGIATGNAKVAGVKADLANSINALATVKDGSIVETVKSQFGELVLKDGTAGDPKTKSVKADAKAKDTALETV